MIPVEVIAGAHADGVKLALAPTGDIRASGPRAALSRSRLLLALNKRAIVRALLSRALHGLTMKELQVAAHPDEWDDIKDNPAALEAFAQALLEDREVNLGRRPDTWTGVATCESCGAIWVPPWMGGLHLPSCRWCANRKAGRPRPKPFPRMVMLGRQVYSEECRPLTWQGVDERPAQPQERQRGPMSARIGEHR